MNERPDATTIGHLAVRWQGDPREARTPAAHLRVERWVHEVDLTPPGLRPGEILIVARLAGLPALTNAPRTSPAWQRAVQRHMADLYRSAVRPVNGRVPAGAASIVFVDEAELLVCLVRDVLAGRAPEQWYWQRLLPNSVHEPPGALLAAGFTHHVTALPAAVSQLAIHEWIQLGNLLTPREAVPVLRAIHRQYALPGPELARWLESPPVSPAFAGPPESRTRPARRDAVTAPWSVWLPDKLAGTIPPACALVLGVSLALYHAPARARTPDFGRAAAAWLEARQRVAVSSTPAHERAVEPVPSAETLPPGQQMETLPDVPQGAEIVPQIKPDGLHTGLGGVLYLINLLAWLDLPHSWDDDLGGQVGAWALVEALARGLLGDEWTHDSLWAVLAALDRRAPGTPAAADLPVPDAYHLPAQWLAQFGPSQPVWTAYQQANRLALVDASAGYCLVDVPLVDQQSPDEQIRAEIAPYEAAGITISWQWAHGWPEWELSASAAAVLGPGLGWWLARVLGFVCDLLARVLGPDLTPLAMLCEPGRIATSHTHVDLTLLLDQIRLPVRRVGLDQNPGWVPDLGHIVLFHFT